MTKLRLVIVASILPLLAGCGGVSDPGSEDPPGNGQGNGGAGGQKGGQGGGGDGQRFPWGLPAGDQDANPGIGTIYEMIRKGECASANAALDAMRNRAPEDVLLTLRERTLLRAGAALCNGDRATAQRYFGEYQWPGGSIASEFECHLYVSAGSYLLQRRKSSFTSCPPLPQVGEKSPGPVETPPSTPTESPDTPSPTTSDPSDPPSPGGGVD